MTRRERASRKWNKRVKVLCSADRMMMISLLLDDYSIFLLVLNILVSFLISKGPMRGPIGPLNFLSYLTLKVTFVISFLDDAAGGYHSSVVRGKSIND